MVASKSLALFSDLEDDDSPLTPPEGGTGTYPPAAPVATCQPADTAVDALADLAVGALSVAQVQVSAVAVEEVVTVRAEPLPVSAPVSASPAMLISAGLKEELLSKSPSSSPRSPIPPTGTASAGPAATAELEEGESDFGDTTIDFATSPEDFLTLDQLEVSVTKDTLVEELRKSIFEQLQRLDAEAERKNEAGKALGEEPLAYKQMLQPHQTTPNFVRVRASVYTPNKPPADILRDGDTVGKALPTPLVAEKVLQIQLLDREEALPPKKAGDVVVLVQRWHRDTWTLGPRHEVYVIFT